MSRVLVVSDDQSAQVEIITEVRDGEPWSFGDCRTCGVRLEHRGDFEDTVEAAEIHVDMQH